MIEKNHPNGGPSLPVGEASMGHPAMRLVHRSTVESSTQVDARAALSDEELMALTCDGDQGAFRVLVERYEDRAVHTARAVVGNIETAREIAQESFLKVYASRDRFDLSRRFSSWFFRILRNLSVDRVRRLGASTPGGASALEGDWQTGDRGPDAEASV
ncbi:MAG: sigma-70 family RNA polymerase sigma factor, partial [Planctomycetes bacterium]|nr:sigma-70 family RNA polymerase sigma factor [Planctomycetota bacterium]